MVNIATGGFTHGWETTANKSEETMVVHMYICIYTYMRSHRNSTATFIKTALFFLPFFFFV